MKFSWRAILCAVLMVSTTGAFKACKSDGPSSGGEDPPQTADDRYEVTGTSATALTVLSNDTNLTHEPLTYSIEDSSVGSASFNADHTVALSLPSGFKGMTKFRYKITNSVGGFSISSVVVFVDVPAYRALFAAKSTSSTSGTYELYVSDFITSSKISNATTGNVRLQNMWKSKTGLLVAYERGDSAQSNSTTELYFVKPTANASPVKFPLALGRSFISGATVAISDDSRWIAYPTNPSSSGTATNLYVLDSNNSGTPTLVGSSANASTGFTQWIGTAPTLYYMAAAGTTGHTLFRVGTSSLDAPERVSPLYASDAQERNVLVSPDGTRVLIVGTHGGQNGAFFIDPTNPNVERRLTTDITSGALIQEFRTDEAVSRLTYLWRAPNSTTARLSVVDIDANSTPQLVKQTNDLVGFSDLRPDGLAALITRSANGVGTDGTLYEVTLDGSAADAPIAPNVTGGVYADADRVYLYSRTLTPSVIQRSDFERTPSPLVRSNTPAGALFVSPIFQPSAAILEDPTSGVVLVNAAAPGKTLKFTDLTIGTLPLGTTLFPTLIGAQ